jgi:SHS2 domain-containing protein
MHEWRSHTAEIELAIEAGRPEDVFAEAAVAFGELVVAGDEGEPARHALSVEASDRASLLVAWLEELIFLADTESFVPEHVEDVELDAHSVRATVFGRRAELEPLVKAATYHDLRFVRANGIWHARVVLDV